MAARTDPAAPHAAPARATVAKVNKLRTPAERAGVVYVGRQFAGWAGTEFGNHGRHGCPGEYRAWVTAQPNFLHMMARLWALTGAGAKPLGCWCLAWDGTGETPACHAAVLAELLNGLFAAAEGGAS